MILEVIVENPANSNFRVSGELCFSQSIVIRHLFNFDTNLPLVTKYSKTFTMMT